MGRGQGVLLRNAEKVNKQNAKACQKTGLTFKMV